MTRKIYYTLPVVLLLIAAFMVGFIAPDVSASRGNPSDLQARINRLPDLLKTFVDRPSNDDTELPVLPTYYKVLGELKDDYYGKTIDDRQLTYSAIRGMLAALDDPYTRFLDPDSYKQMREENEGNFVGIGAQLQVNKDQQVYIKEPIPNSPALAAGVKAGDIIFKVDDKPIAGLDIDQVVDRIRGEEGTRVKLSLLRGPKKKLVELSIVRRMVEFQMVEWKMLDAANGIGYIRLRGFNEHSDSQFESAITQLEHKKLKGLVFDLRQNPGGLLNMAVDIGSRFVESGPIVIIKYRSGQEEALCVENSKHNHKRYPLVVLVDKQSASASEIVTGAIQDNKAGTVVGTNSFGKACVQTVSTLNDGSAVAITTAKYLTPKGRDINKVGVKPDVFVASVEPKSGEDVIEFGDLKKDVQLIKGIEVLKEKLGIPAGKASK
ncbi:MAG: S41 family peptidase [Armatimonadota bacterium]